ncbi:MAG: FAD binding domain-containing protein [Gammaproteobacteria bacterium]|nr:FAD binding domain-containing protein [Gammaproteobacteria bacterium]
MSTYIQPQRLADALAALRHTPHTVLAGGTDLLPADAHAAGWGAHSDPLPVLDISAIDELKTLRRTHERVEIGASVTWTEAIASDLPAWFDCVRMAGREVGGKQIQNRATLAGNICNASPAADGVPTLLALDASVRLRSSHAERELPLADFVLANRRTAIATDELLTAIVIPIPPDNAKSTFLKLGARRYLVISIAMVAVCVSVHDSRIADIRISVGACSEVAVRLAELEARLIGMPLASAAKDIRATDFSPLNAIDDIRATATYREHAAGVLVARALDQLNNSEAA